MDINEQIQSIAAGLIDNLKVSIEQELQDKVTAEVINKVASAELDALINQQVVAQINKRFEDYNFVDVTDNKLDGIVAQVTDTVTKSLMNNASVQVNDYVSQKLAQLDLSSIINSLVDSKIAGFIRTQVFPPNSIPQTSINFTGLSISGDNIKGGIIEQFGSTGIEDRASFVQLTLMDHASAFEGPVFAPSLKVTGNVLISGTLSIADIDTSSPAIAKLIEETSLAVQGKLNTDLFTGFSNTIFDKIKNDGLDLDRITQGGKTIVAGNQLGYHISDTNIQRLGIVRDLQTTGESYLCETLYATKGRVGVNTMEPSSALAVWDEEVEITIGKRGQDLAYIGTARHQTVVLGSNNKNNITLNTDGSVKFNSVLINETKMISATSTPNYEGKLGQIAWNESPDIGSPVGWVCIGGVRWAKFGILQ